VAAAGFGAAVPKSKASGWRHDHRTSCSSADIARGEPAAAAGGSSGHRGVHDLGRCRGNATTLAAPPTVKAQTKVAAPPKVSWLLSILDAKRAAVRSWQITRGLPCAELGHGFFTAWLSGASASCSKPKNVPPRGPGRAAERHWHPNRQNAGAIRPAVLLGRTDAAQHRGTPRGRPAGARFSCFFRVPSPKKKIGVHTEFSNLRPNAWRGWGRARAAGFRAVEIELVD